MDVKHLFWSSGITKYGLLNVWAACIHFFPIFLLASFFPLTTTGWCENLSSSAVFLGYYCKWLNAPLYASLFSFGTLLPFFNFLNFLLGSFIDGVFWFSGLSFFWLDLHLEILRFLLYFVYLAYVFVFRSLSKVSHAVAF